MADVEGLDAYIDAAEAVVAATEVAGLSLYAAWVAEPRVEDAPGRAMQLLALLRELRGSVHIVALVASGVRAPVAHTIKRPGDAFGWDPAPEIGPEDPAKCEAAEALTDQLLIGSYGSLTDDQAKALVTGTEAMAAAIGA